MNLEYGIVTSVFKDNLSGAQLCHVKSNISSREYQNCEIISSKGQNFLPKVGDLVVFSEIHNSEIIVLGILEPFDLNLLEGEVLIHHGTIETQGQNDSYNLQAKIKLDKDNNIEISTGNTVEGTFTPINTIKLEKTGNITIMSTTKITLQAPLVEVI